MENMELPIRKKTWKAGSFSFRHPEWRSGTLRAYPNNP
jgi:hypothetical protein